MVFLARIALFNLTPHELLELYYDRYNVHPSPTIGLLLREALVRLRVRLNMYLVYQTAPTSMVQEVGSWRGKGRYRGLKVVQSCSYFLRGTYSLVQTLLL